MSYKPEVATNREGRTVAQELLNYWHHLADERREAPDLAIASAYVNPGGFRLLADALERAGRVRLLLGAEPDVPESLAQRRHLRSDTLPEDDDRARLREALRAHHNFLIEDRDLIPFTPDEDRDLARLVTWLRSGRVEVRRLTQRFLHGKAFIVESSHDGVLAGSSNLTYAGLARNAELNLGHYQPHIVGEVLDWFEELWAEAAIYDLAALYEQRCAEYSPYLIYLRMLWERYSSELTEEESTTPGLPLTNFQRDGLYRARHYLQQLNGVLIADGVGLGKTYLAGELMRETFQEGRQRVLLIAPAALRDGPWERFLRAHDLKGIQCVSFHQLDRDYRLGADDGHEVLWHDPSEYALVVIDEAHGYRNPETGRARTLRRLLAGTPPKKVMLLTATPVNNSLWDLYHLINYFVHNDAAFLNAGIPSLRRHFAAVEREDPENLSPDQLFDVLDAVAVRRTRRFVKKFYSHDRLRQGNVEVPIEFPQPVIRRADYAFDEVLPGLFERFAHALGIDPTDESNPLPAPSEFHYGEQFSLARYAPSAYRLEAEAESYELQAAGLLRSGLLKRFESSVHAFARTCRTMAESHRQFLEALDAGWVLTGDALAAWSRTDSDEFDPEAIAHGKRDDAADYDVDALRAAVSGDRKLLLEFAAEAESLDPARDPKLLALTEALAEIAADAAHEAVDEADERDKRKVLVFTYYADTVTWIAQGLEGVLATDPRLEAFQARVTTVSGDMDQTNDKLFGFAPRSTEAPKGHPDQYDLLVTTDVLAEGVNLQQARHIINFDLPWNPMRIVQRHGRIDRIGSPHRRVFLRCFFPGAKLDALLGLEAALQRKIAQAAASIGVEGEIVPGSPTREQVFTHTREQIEALQNEDSTLLEDAVEPGALSGEEFRRELANALADPSWARAIDQLPWVAGSGKAVSNGEPGFVFCARVGDYQRPVYRWVPLTADGSMPHTEGVNADTLTCLTRAVCTEQTPRTLADTMKDLAYDAWATARAHILEAWQRDADPRSVQPAIPKPMREARAILEEYPPPELDHQRHRKLLDAIEAPYDTRTQHMVRQCLNAHEDPHERASAIIELIDELGLEPPPPIEPLPEIEESDIHLVCWLALTDT